MTFGDTEYMRASTFHYTDLNSPLLQILSSIVTLFPSGLPSRILTCSVLKGHRRLFVLRSLVCVLDKADHTQLLVHVKLWYRIVGDRGYRMVILAV